MQQVEKELRLNQLKLIVIVTILIFAFMLVYSIFWISNFKKDYDSYEKTWAKVIEHQEINGKVFDMLSYTIDGNEFRITTEYESKDYIGDKVVIYYDTNFPLDIVYSLDSRRIVLPVLTMVFGIVNVGLVVLYFLIKKGVVGQKAKLTDTNQVDNTIEKTLDNSLIQKQSASIIDKNSKKRVNNKTNTNTNKDKVNTKK